MRQVLLEAGAVHSVRDKYDSTALIRATRMGHDSVVKILLEAGADHSIKDNNGDTALMLAACFGYESVVKVLIQAGADNSRLKKKKKKKRKRQQNTGCVICMNSPKTHAFIPCGHKCVCKKCGESCIDDNSKCPLCRKKTTGIIKIYI